MSEKYYEKWEFEPGSLICDQCGAAMEPGEIVLHYMGSDFPVLMPKCPVCGHLYRKNWPAERFSRWSRRWRISDTGVSQFTRAQRQGGRTWN